MSHFELNGRESSSGPALQCRTCSPQLAVDERQQRLKLWGFFCQALINKMFRLTVGVQRGGCVDGIALSNPGFHEKHKQAISPI